MPNEEIEEKLISLSLLAYYDEKIKNYIKQRGGMTEEEIEELIQTKIDNSIKIEII